MQQTTVWVVPQIDHQMPFNAETDHQMPFNRWPSVCLPTSVRAHCSLEIPDVDL